MSDTPQRPGWWQASDDRWYPPESPPGSTTGRDVENAADEVVPRDELLVVLAVPGLVAVVVLGVVLNGDTGEGGQDTGATGEVGTTTDVPSDTVDEVPDGTAAPTTATGAGPEDEARSEQQGVVCCQGRQEEGYRRVDPPGGAR